MRRELLDAERVGVDEHVLHEGAGGQRRELGVEDIVAETGGFSPAMLVTLGEKGIKTLDDLADLAADELIEMLGEGSVDEETANAIIMSARQHWFGEDAAAAAEPSADETLAEDLPAGEDATTTEASDAPRA